MAKNTAGERVHPHPRIPSLHKRCSMSVLVLVVFFPLLDALLFRPSSTVSPPYLKCGKGERSEPYEGMVAVASVPSGDSPQRSEPSGGQLWREYSKDRTDM